MLRHHEVSDEARSVKEQLSVDLAEVDWLEKSFLGTDPAELRQRLDHVPFGPLGLHHRLKLAVGVAADGPTSMPVALVKGANQAFFIAASQEPPQVA